MKVSLASWSLSFSSGVTPTAASAVNTGSRNRPKSNDAPARTSTAPATIKRRSHSTYRISGIEGSPRRPACKLRRLLDVTVHHLLAVGFGVCLQKPQQPRCLLGGAARDHLGCPTVSTLDHQGVGEGKVHRLHQPLTLGLQGTPQGLGLRGGLPLGLLYRLVPLFRLTGTHVDPAEIVEVRVGDLPYLQGLFVLPLGLLQVSSLQKRLRQPAPGQVSLGVELQNLAIVLLGVREIAKRELQRSQFQVDQVVVRVPIYRLPEGADGLLVPALLLADK